MTTATTARSALPMSALCLVLSTALAAPAMAAECSLDVLKAYQTAKARGWQFSCTSVPGISANFVTYPPASIGCVFKTPPMVPPGNPVWGGAHGFIALFGAQAGVPALKNGWTFVRYEIEGGPFVLLPPAHSMVAAGANLNKPGHTANYRLSKLIIQRSGSSCSSAIEQAF